jgi:D-glycero-D-manno-heptose 1,7-bisphosphate phosphatase
MRSRRCWRALIRGNVSGYRAFVRYPGRLNDTTHSQPDALRPCVFLDRDGVINVAPPSGEYVLHWEQFRLIPEIVDWIRLFNVLGYLVIVVTNQRCIGRGMVTQAEVDELHGTLRAELGRVGARIDDVFVCPHGDGECDCRKPQPGMIRQAAAKWNIDLSRSLMIGDSWRDQELARNAGVAFIAVSEGRIQAAETLVKQAFQEVPYGDQGGPLC